jgi:phage-related minor tail protein
MNEDEKRREILKAEAAIRELAARMAQASEYARQADVAKSMMESSARSIDELCIESRTLMESYRAAVREENESINQAMESFDICMKNLQEARERFEKRADYFETALEKKNQEFYRLLESKLDNQSRNIDEVKDQFMIRAEHLDISIHKQSQAIHELIDAEARNLSQDINKAQEHLSEKADHLEASVDESCRETFKLFDAKLGSLSQDINTISDKLSFVIEQNDALCKEILALQPILKELSTRFQGFGNALNCNSEEILELRTQVIDSNEKSSSARYGAGSKTSGIFHRLISAIR